MNKPLISLVIPCYNGENFIDICLESVINQTYTNLEILIMNDGSQDNSLAILQEWSRKDNRIKIFTQENKGLANSRNALISKATGLYFTLLDIDDTLLKNSIELLYENSLNGKVDIIVGRTNGVYYNGNLKLPYFPVWRRKKRMTNLQYVKSNICTPWSSLIRKDFYDELDVEFLPNRVFEDIGLMPYIYLKSNTFVAINDITYNYHKHKTDAISNFASKSFLKRNDLIANTNSLFKKIKLEGWERENEYSNSINGILFVILLLNDILVNNFTYDLKIRKLLRHNFYNLLDSFGWKIKIIRTPWKFLGFIYLKMTYIKINRKGSIFFRTFRINFIDSNSRKTFLGNVRTNTLEFTKKMLAEKYEGSKNTIIEVKENDYIENYEEINVMKNKYILINVKDNRFSKFTKYLSYENINGIIINSKIFEAKHLRENENFLIVCIKYKHVDEFSLRKLTRQLNELNYMIRRPLIFLKCSKDKRIINATKKMIDSFIFMDEIKLETKEEEFNVK
ncbi:MAG: glycosyltransferase family 2 protein [Metamycoplasmataceae bacterium]